jgi:hypothetical protein
MTFRTAFAALFCLALIGQPATASAFWGSKEISYEEAKERLEPHKALYDIDLVATRSGSPIVNISGKMFYEWKPTCGGWITDHRFNLLYEYADSPAMQITSDFSTYESFEGKDFNFSARRKRNDQLYQEFRGHANFGKGAGEKAGLAEYSIPDELEYGLDESTFFPMTHTVKMIQKALNEDKFFHAVVFDGSDEEGPVEINAFIGKEVDALKQLGKTENLDKSLLKTPAWNVRMAVFPEQNDSPTASYEMSIVFHENGVISDMLVDYEDFSVTQKLIALEKLKPVSCPE